jgi:hypothetical protein
MIPFSLSIDGHNYVFSSQEEMEDKINEKYIEVYQNNVRPYFSKNEALYWYDIDILHAAYAKVNQNLIDQARSKFNHTSVDSLVWTNFSGLLFKSLRREIQAINTKYAKGGLSRVSKDTVRPRFIDWANINENDLRETHRDEKVHQLKELNNAYRHGRLRRNESRLDRQTKYLRINDILQLDFDNELLQIRWGLKKEATRQRKSRILAEFINWCRENNSHL